MKTNIGGQAVIEGVMMRGASSMALSVRDELGNIRTETTRFPAKKPWYRKVPFLRGIVNLVISMVEGTKIIGKSAEVMAEEVDPDGDSMGFVMTISTMLGIVLALGLFVGVPTAISAGIFALFKLDANTHVWLKSLIEGVAKMLVLVCYMSAISAMKEIRRVFMYHGAEHKTIACYESELPLTVENVQKCSRYHDRCGTSFIVFVVVLSIVLMMVLDVVLAACGVTMFFESSNWWLRMLLKIALLPVTAGISYEVLMGLAKTNFVLFRPLKWLGKQFQRLTTREPSDDMCEVAIASFNAVLQMDADQTIPEVRFPEPMTIEEFKSQIEKSVLPQATGVSDIDWLTAAVLNIKTEHLANPKLKVPFGWTLRLAHMANRIADGEPWQYVVSREQFGGRDFYVDKDVLIPRPETELVVEQATKLIHNGDKVLDLCCGSGIVGVTIASDRKVNVTFADVSKKAIRIAKFNAKNNKIKGKFVVSNMFAAVKGKYNAIVCNPPYIETATINTLDSSVKDYEPHLALDGGADGLDFYRTLAAEAHKHLLPNGVLVMEIGYNQGATVPPLFADKYDVTLIKDYSHNDRIVVCKLK